MSLIRPELRAAFHRWREVIAAGAVAAAGLWLIGLGGYLFHTLGALVVLGGLALARGGWRRLRFARAATAPGVVEVIEGQVGWYGPGIGGFAALPELAELGLVTVAGLRCWRLRQHDGQVLLIPVAATGAEKLYDAFGALPGLDPAVLLAALDDPADRPVIWRHGPRPLLPRQP